MIEDIDKFRREVDEKVKETKKRWKCIKCGYESKGVTIKEKDDDIFNHIGEKHPEMRIFKE